MVIHGDSSSSYVILCYDPLISMDVLSMFVGVLVLNVFGTCVIEPKDGKIGNVAAEFLWRPT